MELNMLLNEGRDIEEAVVVSSTTFPQMGIVGLDQLRLKVVDQHLLSELVSCSDVDEGRDLVVVAGFEELGGVVVLTFLFRVGEEHVECLDAPACGF